jgi:cell wall-associated NlpC family hydrolase
VTQAVADWTEARATRQGRRAGGLTARFKRHPLFLKSIASVVTAAFLLLTLQPLAIAANLPGRAAPVAPAPPDESATGASLHRGPRLVPIDDTDASRDGGGRATSGTEAERLVTTLEQVDRHLDKLDTKIRKRQDTTPERNELKVLRTEIHLLDRKALADFDDIERHIKEKNLPPEILKRHQDAVKQYKQEMNTLKTNLDEVYWAEDDAQRGPKLKKAKEHLEAKQKRPPRKPLDPKNLPTRSLQPNKGNKPKLRKEEFRAAGLYDNPTVKLAALGDFRFDQLPGASDPAYLAATPDVVLSDVIRAKAQDLAYDPVKIYQFVRNNIEWVPSWGSIQGAELTLKSLKGNSVDTASLLIALLRASLIPARYVHGTVEVPVEKFMNWAGGFTDANSAWNFASSGGVPVTALTSGGRVSAFVMEHVWVEAAIDFHPSRGAVNKSADSWVALDASYKQYDITPGIDVTAAVPFNASDYLSQIRSESPVMYYQRGVQDYFDANLPDKRLADAMDLMLVRLDEGSFLPSNLPYKVLVSANRYGTLPAALRVTAQFELNRLNQIDPEQFSLDTVSLADKRLTLVYEPASPSDAAVIAQYGGDMYAVPPYLLYLVPTLKSDGQVLYQGSAIQMGTEQTLTIGYSGAYLTAQSMPHKLISGGYYAVGLNLQGAGTFMVGDKNLRLNNALARTDPENIGKDDLIGEHLATLIGMYFLTNDSFYRGAAKLYRVAEQRILSVGLVSFTLTVRYFFGIPRSASPNRAQFDVGLEATQAISREGNAAKRNAYLEIRGLQGSYSESRIFESIHGFDSVSAVKGIQAAYQQGVPVYTINQANFAHLFPTLQLGSEDLQEIQQGVQAGLVAIVPQREIVINDWRGVGFIVKDLQTHSGVYRISGGLAGGSTTSNTDGWRIVSLSKAPFAGLRDRLDVMTRAIIADVAWLEYARSEWASALDRTKLYDTVEQCSGLVRTAYYAAGICLDRYAREGARNGEGCLTNNLADRFGVSGAGNGVRVHFAIAEQLQAGGFISFAVRTTNDPLIGDIVFFDYTRKDSNGNAQQLTHEGIVVASPTENGTIHFIHAYRPAIELHRMNIQDPGNRSLNGYIGDPNWCESGGYGCRSGQLFHAYGTIRNVGRP